MNKKKIILILLYTLSFIAILWYPVSKILRFEFPAEPPTEIKFNVTLYDPYDPMRGRFVRLQVRPDIFITSDKTSRFSYRDNAYIVLEKDKNSYAKLLRIEKEYPKLKKGEIAVKVNRIWYYGQYKKTSAHYKFNWPFDRFYLNELKAPALEEELQKRSNKFVLTVQFFSTGGFAVKNLSKQ